MGKRIIADRDVNHVGVFVATLLVVLLSAATSQGQVGQQILLFSDPTYTSTYAYDSAPGTLTVYVVHESLNDEAQGSLFAIRASDGFTGVWLNESSPYTAFGTSPTGISIGYQTCLSGRALVLQVNYAIFGTSDECASLQVVNHPSYPEGIIEIPTCSFDLLRALGGTLIINPTEACALRTERTTWGKVKGLYR